MPGVLDFLRNVRSNAADLGEGLAQAAPAVLGAIGQDITQAVLPGDQAGGYATDDLLAAVGQDYRARYGSGLEAALAAAYERPVETALDIGGVAALGHFAPGAARAIGAAVPGLAESAQVLARMDPATLGNFAAGGPGAEMGAAGLNILIPDPNNPGRMMRGNRVLQEQMRAKGIDPQAQLAQMEAQQQASLGATGARIGTAPQRVQAPPTPQGTSPSGLPTMQVPQHLVPARDALIQARATKGYDGVTIQDTLRVLSTTDDPPDSIQEIFQLADRIQQTRRASVGYQAAQRAPIAGANTAGPGFRQPVSPTEALPPGPDPQNLSFLRRIMSEEAPLEAHDSGLSRSLAEQASNPDAVARQALTAEEAAGHAPAPDVRNPAAKAQIEDLRERFRTMTPRQRREFMLRRWQEPTPTVSRQGEDVHLDYEMLPQARDLAGDRAGSVFGNRYDLDPDSDTFLQPIDTVARRNETVEGANQILGIGGKFGRATGYRAPSFSVKRASTRALMGLDADTLMNNMSDADLLDVAARLGIDTSYIPLEVENLKYVDGFQEVPTRKPRVQPRTQVNPEIEASEGWETLARAEDLEGHQTQQMNTVRGGIGQSGSKMPTGTKRGGDAVFTGEGPMRPNRNQMRGGETVLKPDQKRQVIADIINLQELKRAELAQSLRSTLTAGQEAAAKGDRGTMLMHQRKIEALVEELRGIEGGDNTVRKLLPEAGAGAKPRGAEFGVEGGPTREVLSEAGGEVFGQVRKSRESGATAGKRLPADQRKYLRGERVTDPNKLEKEVIGEYSEARRRGAQSTSKTASTYPETRGYQPGERVLLRGQGGKEFEVKAVSPDGRKVQVVRRGSEAGNRKPRWVKLSQVEGRLEIGATKVTRRRGTKKTARRRSQGTPKTTPAEQTMNETILTGASQTEMTPEMAQMLKHLAENPEAARVIFEAMKGMQG